MHSNPTNIHTLHSNALRHLLQVSRDTSGQQQTPTDTKQHQQTPNNTNRRCQTPKKGVQGCVAAYVDIKCRLWRLLVSNDVLYCLMLSADVKRMSKKFLKGYLSAEWI